MIWKGIKWPFTRKFVSNIGSNKNFSKSMKDFLARDKAKHSRYIARKGAIKNIRNRYINHPNSSKARMKSIVTYPKLLAKQIKEYAKETASDITHPLASFKRQFKMFTSHVQHGPKGSKLYRRSPLGTGAMAATYWGLPAYWGYKEFKKKDPTAENEARGLATTLSALTPKGWASYGIYSLPDAIKWKRKK